MFDIQRFKTFQEYFDLTKQIKDYNPFLYFHLENSIKEVAKNQNDLEDLFYVNKSENYTFCLWKKNECLLYSNNENSEMINSITDQLCFEKFKSFTFSGTKNIIDKIFSNFNVSSEQIKYRNYYKCNTILKNFNLSEGKLAMADQNYLIKLSEFIENFKSEFYAEHNPKSSNVNAVMHGIGKNNLYQWEIKGIPVAILQLDYDEYDFPIIRFVYVEKKYRCLGISSSIVYETTKGLLNNGYKECMLYTDGNNPFSNRSFQKAGYELIGEYISKFKNK